MEWIYFVLIIAFLTWSVQIYLVYHRQVDKIEAQIDATQTSQQDVILQAEEFEKRAQEVTEQLVDLKAESDTLEKTEKGLEQELGQYRQQQASRRPTRHRVDLDEGTE
ncbi:MAG: chromosome segregation ATPase [Candidatus Latescibacterota bacterium]